MLNERSPLISSDQQLDLVRKINTPNDYFSFYYDHFSDFSGSPFERVIRGFLVSAQLEGSPDYLRVLAMSGCLAAQHGFEAMDGQFIRHFLRNWKKDALSVEHQTGLIVYLGAINEQAYPIKRDWVNRLETSGFELANEIWGVELPVSQGVVRRYSNETLANLQKMAISRANRRKPVLLPTRDINMQLSRIKFTGDDADVITMQSFDKDPLPQVAKIFEGVFDLTNI